MRKLDQSSVSTTEKLSVYPSPDHSSTDPVNTPEMNSGLEPTLTPDSISAPQPEAPAFSILRGHAIFLGRQLQLDALATSEILADNPLVVKAGTHGYAVLFSYGVAVLFGLQAVEEATFITQLQPLIQGAFETPEMEDINLVFDAEKPGRYERDKVYLYPFSVEQLQIVADVLAKSVVLEHYEIESSVVFEQIEPFSRGLQKKAKNERWGKELLRQLGQVLAIQHNIVGRVEIIDKPELLWDEPMLERIYLRLEDEYEIRERHSALERKLELISRTAETVLDLMQHNTNLRVEWYIVILIVIEILLSLYDLFLKG